MRTQMHFQHVAFIEPLAANGAAVSSRLLIVDVVRVVSHVFIQVTALRKCAVAQGACIWSLAGVQTHMRLQIVALGEASVALRTRKRPLSSVCTLVTL